MVNVPKHCWNLHHRTSMKMTDHCQVSWVGKSLPYWPADTCLKRPLSEDPSTSKTPDVPKHFSNLHHNIFVSFVDRSQVKCVGKSLSYWHAKSWYCLLTHWLLMESILFLIETIYRYQFRYNYLRNKKLFLTTFLKSRLNFKHFEKKYDRHSFYILEFTDSENVAR